MQDRRRSCSPAGSEKPDQDRGCDLKDDSQDAAPIADIDQEGEDSSASEEERQKLLRANTLILGEDDNAEFASGSESEDDRLPDLVCPDPVQDDDMGQTLGADMDQGEDSEMEVDGEECTSATPSSSQPDPEQDHIFETSLASRKGPSPEVVDMRIGLMTCLSKSVPRIVKYHGA